MVTPEIVSFLNKNQWSAFYRSLLFQYEQRGSLSQKQIECVLNAINKAQNKEMVRNEPKEFSLKLGQVIEIKKFVAQRLKMEQGLPYFFRNLEVTEVLNETQKAYQLKVKFVSKIVTSCHVCGLHLDTDVSRATGIGPVCADRLGLKRPTLETAQETLRAIDALCSSVGIIGPIWVPKSQIKTSEETSSENQLQGVE